jgi:hypothetical protein
MRILVLLDHGEYPPLYAFVAHCRNMLAERCIAKCEMGSLEGVSKVRPMQRMYRK